jgi:hypothetical protein
MENKYLLLRAIAVLFEIVGWLILILGMLGTLLFVASTGVIDLGVLAGRVPLGNLWRELGLPTVSALPAVGFTGLGSLLSFLVLCGMGELIFLLLDIEQNTRETAHFLRPRT